MKKYGIILLFTLLFLLSACGCEHAGFDTTENTATATLSTEESAADNSTQPQRITQTTLPPVSYEFVFEDDPSVENNDSVSRSIILDASELRPDNGIWALGGNRLCFGQYHGLPIVYRILSSPDTQSFEENKDGLFIDCDYVLELKKFDDNFRKNDTQINSPSEWMGSDIDIWLNSSDFYGNSIIFSDIEKASILYTTLDEHVEPYSIGNWTYEDFGSSNYLFLISAAEANQLYLDNPARVKNGQSVHWWLRSSFGSIGNGAGSVHEDGHICNNSISIYGVGVCPALNIDLSAILFASATGTDKTLDLNEAGAKIDYNTSRKWKLTLLDTSMTVNLTEGKTVMRLDTDAECVITVPFTYTGDNANQISVMITDKPHTDCSAQVLYYGALQGISMDCFTDAGTFTLPSQLERQICGENYYVYIIAEAVNGCYETDYASEFCEIFIPAASAAG